MQNENKGNKRYVLLLLFSMDKIMAREFSKSFYNSKEWQQCREYCLKRDNYLCVMCGKPAEEVHHIIHLSQKNIGDISITLNPDNLTSLCKNCHFDAHRGEHGKGRQKNEQINQYAFDENGMIVPIPPG